MKKIVLITGGGSNLGREIISLFEKAGFKVYSPISRELDITNDESCRKFVRKIVRVNKKIDVLVNCAGITPVGLAIDSSSADFLNVLNVNAVGAFRVIKEAISYMPHKGKIINISSLNGVSSFPNYGIYSASKHALEAISFALRHELRSKGIRVTNILSGAILNEKRNPAVSSRRAAREKFLLLKLLMPFLTASGVAKSVMKVVESDNPPGKVILGSDSKIILTLMKVLPFDLWDKLVSYVWSHK